MKKTIFFCGLLFFNIFSFAQTNYKDIQTTVSYLNSLSHISITVSEKENNLISVSGFGIRNPLTKDFSANSGSIVFNMKDVTIIAESWYLDINCFSNDKLILVNNDYYNAIIVQGDGYMLIEVDNYNSALTFLRKQLLYPEEVKDENVYSFILPNYSNDIYFNKSLGKYTKKVIKKFEDENVDKDTKILILPFTNSEKIITVLGDKISSKISSNLDEYTLQTIHNQDTTIMKLFQTITINDLNSPEYWEKFLKKFELDYIITGSYSLDLNSNFKIENVYGYRNLYKVNNLKDIKLIDAYYTGDCSKDEQIYLNGLNLKKLK